jgi:hypothetical protein
MAGVTVFALISYWVTPEEAWLPRQRISRFINNVGTTSTSETTIETAPK